MYKFPRCAKVIHGGVSMDYKMRVQLKILKLNNLKPNFSELARIYHLDRRTIKKYYDGYQGKPIHRLKTSMLDQYRDIISLKMALKGVTIRAVYEFIRARIAPNIGSYSNFRKYILKNNLKPAKNCSGHPRFETPAGHQAQVDWKEDMKITSRSGEVFTFQVFDYKLGYSRYCHFTYKNSKTRQDVFDCLIESFMETGGVPAEILFDNMPSVVDLKDNRRHINNQMKAFAADFGFRVRLAKPRHPFTKGKVEALNKFLSWIIPYEREFETEDELVQILKDINRQVNSRPCQETGVPPVLLFQKEKEHLRSLPGHKVIDSYLSHRHVAKVQKDSLITYQNHRYSVPPAYIGKYVWVKQTDSKLYIYYNTEQIAIHNISSRKLNYTEEHYVELLRNIIGSEDVVSAMAEANLRQMDNFL